ncbi:MAG TPA: hypothetical protein V6D07_01730 [Trichocoleus sp.]
MELTVAPKRIAKFICLTILGLTTAHISMKVLKYLMGSTPIGYRLFDFDNEQNIPAWYSSSLLLFCAGLLYFIAQIKHRSAAPYRYYWSFLSLVFLGLSLDEAVSLHEELIEPLRTNFNLSGVLYFSWVIPGIALVGILGFVYWKFLADLPAQTRKLILIAASLYLVGAVGCELVGGKITEMSSSPRGLYGLVITLEELLEMLGLNVFLYALMSYLVPYLQTWNPPVKESLSPVGRDLK